MSAAKILDKVTGLLTVRNETVRQGLAEALATFLLMLFGQGSVAQVVLGKKNFGEYLSINLGFGFGVMLGIHAAGGISEALQDYTGGNLTVDGPTGTAGIFATYPAPHMSIFGGFVNEFITTAVLLIGILSIHDMKNAGALPGTNAFITGLLVTVIGMSMGMNTGYAINPSRDLPPRIFTAIAGWGLEVFKASDCWWWVPVVAPTLGSLAGIFIYNIFVDFHNRPQSKPSGNSETGKQDLECAMSYEQRL
ncbi:aquaporin-7-like isoform X3 [Rhineura floridana]|uniref:aquaporin-7-like isoform X3 n=1 Tax=Rhineura floridana TaxID=261503 RepID=UPI002AC87E32|nr:aquaporin-7-like isoform X3 [Rhineura floridana]